MYVLIFSTNLSKKILILRRIERDMIKKIYIGLHIKCQVFLSDFKETWIFSTDFRKILKKIKFHKNPSSGRRVVPCRVQTDRHDEANSSFSKFYDSP